MNEAQHENVNQTTQANDLLGNDIRLSSFWGPLQVDHSTPMRFLYPEIGQ
jgi:hypothetical protein